MKNKKKIPPISSGIKTLFEILDPGHKGKFIYIVLLAIFVAIFEVIAAIFIANFSKILFEPQEGIKYFEQLRFIDIRVNEENIILVSSIILGIIFLVKNILAIVEVFYHNFSIQKICYNFKEKIFSLYLYSDYNFYLNRNSAKSIEVLHIHIETTLAQGLIALANILIEFIVLICLLMVLIYLNPSVALSIMFICLFTAFIIQKIFLPRYYYWGKDLLNNYDDIQKFLIEVFNCTKEINIFKKQIYFLNKFSNFVRKFSRSKAFITATNSIPRFFLEILFVSIFIFTIFFLTKNNYNFNELVGLLGAFLYAGFRIMPGLNRIINQVNIFKSSIPSIETVSEELKSLRNNEIQSLNYASEKKMKFTDSIKLSNINLYYKNKKPVLRNINLNIKKGEIIGIIGPTGSGKSSLINIISGIQKPKSGEVIIDGKKLVNPNLWKNNIAFVSQNIFLLDNSIKRNIAFGENKINMTKLLFAIQNSQLKDTIEKLDEGIDTFIGEHGKELSGGQIQRIAIARALYLNRKILIFDEATSALDLQTERKILSFLKKKTYNATVIIVTHKPNTIKFCDKIYKITDGRINRK